MAVSPLSVVETPSQRKEVTAKPPTPEQETDVETEALRLFAVVDGPYATKSDLKYYWFGRPKRERIGWRTLAREVLELKRKTKE